MQREITALLTLWWVCRGRLCGGSRRKSSKPDYKDERRRKKSWPEIDVTPIYCSPLCGLNPRFSVPRNPSGVSQTLSAHTVHDSTRQKKTKTGFKTARRVEKGEANITFLAKTSSVSFEPGDTCKLSTRELPGSDMAPEFISSKESLCTMTLK